MTTATTMEREQAQMRRDDLWEVNAANDVGGNGHKLTLSRRLADGKSTRDGNGHAGGNDVRVWTWTVRRYHRAIKLGFFDADQPYQLIEGKIYVMPAKGIPHTGTTRLLMHTLTDTLIFHNCAVFKEDPVVLSRKSEPEPDILVVRGKIQEYYTRHAHAEDVLFAIEVSHSTERFDRTVKYKMYAKAGVPEYWNLLPTTKTLIIHSLPGTRPDGTPTYTQKRIYGVGDSVTLPVGGEITVSLPVAEMFPDFGTQPLESAAE